MEIITLQPKLKTDLMLHFLLCQKVEKQLFLHTFPQLRHKTGAALLIPEEDIYQILFPQT